MTIPLDQLYNYLESCVDHDLIIYRWNPHGSRNLDDLTPLKDYQKSNGIYYSIVTPSMICHDQEPLDYEFYSVDSILEKFKTKHPRIDVTTDQANIWMQDLVSQLNFKAGARTYHYTAYDYTLLLHSEKNSHEVEKYQRHNFLPVYYWSHALIARDWFRYAEIDPLLDQKNAKYDFLIYNRAWSGTRQYRLTFAELLIDHQLHHQVNMKFSPTDQGMDYRSCEFLNPDLSINRNDLENYFPLNLTSSCASASYSAKDYQDCRMEIVLETLFDDQRLHLTEKALRPIACGMPFVLVAASGSLEYLRSYGFKTFGSVIDESYDSISDPLSRLSAVINLMKEISQLPLRAKQEMFSKMNVICDHNREVFFSKKFTDQVTNEYVTNMNQAMQSLQNKSTGYIFNSGAELYKSQGLGTVMSPTDHNSVLDWLATRQIKS